MKRASGKSLLILLYLGRTIAIDSHYKYLEISMKNRKYRISRIPLEKSRTLNV